MAVVMTRAKAELAQSNKAQPARVGGWFSCWGWSSGASIGLGKVVISVECLVWNV